jgi:hypothetical protein
MSQSLPLNGHAAQTTLPPDTRYWKARAEALESQLDTARRIIAKLAELLPIEYLHYLSPLSLGREADSLPNSGPLPTGD